MKKVLRKIATVIELLFALPCEEAEEMKLADYSGEGR